MGYNNPYENQPFHNNPWENPQQQPQPSQPGGSSLSITNYFLIGGLPAILKPYQESNAQYQTMYAMKNAREAISRIADQVAKYRRQNNRWPSATDSYLMGEAVRVLKAEPVAMGVILVDAILLAAHEDLPSDKAKNPAVYGIAYRILELYNQTTLSKESAAEKVAFEIVTEIEEALPPGLQADQNLIAHMLFIRELGKNAGHLPHPFWL